MNPLTLTTTTFLLYQGSSLSGTPIPATITYDPINFIATVSYTHLDVYKRQIPICAR